MFWSSIVAGLKVLTHWETYVVGIEYLAVFFVPMIVIGAFMGKNELIGNAFVGLSMFLLPVLQVVAMVVFVLTLAPIILGLSSEAAWSFPWVVMAHAPGAFLKLLGVIVVAAFILAFVPFFGDLQSLQTLVLGGIALIFVLGLLDSINPGYVEGRVDFYPGFWFTVGLLAIGGIMSWIGTMVAALVAMALEVTREGLGLLVMFPISAIFGFIPVFIYGAWLGAQLR